MLEHQSASRLGLPADVDGLLFDVDGVLLDTEGYHALAWAEAIDEFLRNRAEAVESQPPFDPEGEYPALFAGRSSADGLAAFLERREIDIPEGSPTDVPSAPTRWGLINRKQRYFDAHVDSAGISAYPSSVDYLRAARAAGFPCAAVTSSKDVLSLLAVAAVGDLFDVVVDAGVIAQRHLRGKPSPDPYVTAAQELGVVPSRAAVFEDSLAGISAGRAGSFRCVIGIDRAGNAERLRDRGADIVVRDLSELLVRN